MDIPHILADKYVLLSFACLKQVSHDMALLLIKTKTHIKVNNIRILNYREDIASSAHVRLIRMVQVLIL